MPLYKDPFWLLAKPNMPKKGTYEDYKRIARKAAREYLLTQADDN